MRVLVVRTGLSLLSGVVLTWLMVLGVREMGRPLDMAGVAVVFVATAATQWICLWARDRGSWW